MSRHVPFRQADLARALRAIADAGAVGKYEIHVDNRGLRVLPVGESPASDAEDLERRMEEAFRH